MCPSTESFTGAVKHSPSGIFRSPAHLIAGMFLIENLRIQNNVIESAWKHDVKRLLFLGSSCIYPKFSKQPIKEEELLKKDLESTNECYAIAKIAGIKLCQALRMQYQFDAIFQGLLHPLQ